MKKILGISLCALFAVSAANANIASQEYVDQVVGGIDISGITTNANAITALDGRVTTSEGKISTLEGKVSTNETNIATNAGNITANTTAISGINTTIAGMTENETGSHFIQGVSQSNGTVTATGKNFETTLSATTNDNAPTSKAVADHVKGAINALNVTATTGHYVKVVSQSNGSVQATGASFDDEVTATSENAPTSKAVATYVDGKVNNLDVGALEGRVGTNETNITNLTSRVGTNEAGIGTLNSSMTTLSEKVDINTDNIATLENKITEHTEAIQDMDLIETTGDYVKVVSQANGTVSATGASFAGDVATGNTNAPTSAAVVTYVADNAVQTVVAGETNGTIVVDNQEVAIPGLQAMAYKAAVTNLDITDETITNADISPTAAILSSKISFTREQSNALNSGITSDLVGKITTNETNIASNATNITDMGRQVTTNKENITDLQGRMTTAETKIVNNANAISAINSILNATGTEACNTAAGCTLVHDSNGFKWEAVKR